MGKFAGNCEHWRDLEEDWKTGPSRVYVLDGQCYLSVVCENVRKEGNATQCPQIPAVQLFMPMTL